MVWAALSLLGSFGCLVVVFCIIKEFTFGVGLSSLKPYQELVDLRSFLKQCRMGMPSRLSISGT